MAHPFPYQFIVDLTLFFKKSRMAIIWLMWHVNFLLTLTYFSSMALKPPLFIGLQFCLSELYTGLVEFFPQSFPESKSGLDFFLKALEKNRAFQAVGRNLKSARDGWRDGRCSVFWKLLGMVFTYVVQIQQPYALLSLYLFLVQLNEEQQQKLKVCD